MSRAFLTNRRAGRCHPGLEGLDARLALSTVPWVGSLPTIAAPPVSASRLTSTGLGASLTVVAVDPAPGDVARGPVGAFSVTFDRPLDPFSVTGFDDLRLDRRDGEDWVRAYGDFETPLAEIDPSGDTLRLTLAAPLGPGDYRIVLPAWSVLSGMDGSTFADTSDDQTLGEFRIEQPGVGLDDANDLGLVGEFPTLVTGTLDFGVDPRQIRLYRFTLPEGHRWRFGAEVTAQREGSALRSALALFDAQGQLLQSASIGRPDYPFDPYLFAGLEPGDYYLGISSAFNVPGAPGAYDVSAAIPGIAASPETGGGFRLNLVADRADDAVMVVGIGLRWIDPSMASPTGLTIAFSGPLDARALASRPGEALEVIGDDGRVWPLTAVGVNETGARYDFLLHEALPAGHYNVRRVADGGLLDLSGLVPTAMNLPDGVLGRFNVEARRARRHDPLDLGPLYDQSLSGISTPTAILPGTAVTYRFVALSDGLYRINAPDAIGPVTVNLIGPEGLTTRRLDSDQSVFVNLKAGVHLLQFVNQGTTPVPLDWGLELSTLWDSLLENGIGQGPALSLRFAASSVAPDSFAPDGSVQGPTVTVSYMGSIGPFSAVSGSTSPTITLGTAAPTPGGLSLTFAGNPVGMPNPEANHVESIALGRTALASAGSTLPAGIGYGQSVDVQQYRGLELPDGPDRPRGPDDPSRAIPRSREDDPGAVADADASLPESVAPVDGAVMAENENRKTANDAEAVASADWLTNLGTIAARLMALELDFTPDADVATVPSQPVVAEGDDLLPSNAGRVERATVSAPLVVGIGTVMAMRYSQPLRQWLRRRHATPIAQTKANSAGIFRGPHRRP